MPWKATALFFFIWLSAGGPASAAESADEEGAASTSAFIWWSPDQVKRLADGRASQVLTLKTSPPSRAIQPQAWLRVIPLRRYNQPDPPEKALWLRGEWLSTEPWILAAAAGEYAQVDAFARAEIDGQPHFAQTRLLLYGQSRENESGPEAQVQNPGPAEFQVSSNGEFYWPQTGHEFTFALQGLEAAGGGLEVRDGLGELLDRAKTSEGAFKYTPAHDRALDRAGYAAAKTLVFVARDAAGDSASFTLVVHRSRLAGLNLPAGLAVFAAAFSLCGLGVGLARLRGRPC